MRFGGVECEAVVCLRVLVAQDGFLLGGARGPVAATGLLLLKIYWSSGGHESLLLFLVQNFERFHLIRHGARFGVLVDLFVGVIVEVIACVECLAEVGEPLLIL